MASGDKITDGHQLLAGVNGSVPFFTNNRTNVVSAVNRSFRGGRNLCRPGLSQLRLSFDTDESRVAFELGAISGACGYRSWRGISDSQIVVCVHDRILAGTPYGGEIRFRTIKTGLTVGCLMGWFAQVNDRIYFQNDIDEPVGWDGIGFAYRPGGSTDNLPIGSAMFYGMGRLAVIAQKDYMILSDHVYGNGVSSTDGAEKFIEYQYYSDLGAIGSYAELGSPVGITSLPVMDSANGSETYLVVCPNGFWTFDPSGARADWLYSLRQRKSFEGNGCPAPYGFTIVGSDLFYQSTDGGIESYRYVQSDNSQYWGRLPISNEVESYLSYTPPDRRRFVSMMSFDNRVVASVAIRMAPSSLGGWHRFGQGMIALDVSRSTVSESTSGFSWDGLWTGPNPIQFVSLQGKYQRDSFVLSHDDDGVNRIYQFTDKRHDQFDGKRKNIVSFYDTPYYLTEFETNLDVYEKRVDDVKVVFGGLTADVAMAVKARVAGSPRFSELMGGREIKIKSPGKFEMPFYSPQGGIAASGARDKNKCGGTLSGIGHQFRVGCSGDIEITKLVVRATMGNELRGEPCGDTPCKREPADDTDLFKYKIAT